MRQVRAFLAIPFSEIILLQAQRVQRRLAEQLSQVRWVAPDAMHLTLRFFGDIPEESLDRIGKVMLSIGSLSVSFQAEVGGLGAFPSPGRARVIWLGIHGGQPLADLHGALEEGLTTIGLPGDGRPFAPHLTLGRIRGRPLPAREILGQFHDVACGTLVVDRMTLFESRLRPSGALHLPVKTVYLGKTSEG